jgi:hypothetical protein
MILTLVNWAVSRLYDLRMETVWQTYGARVVNLCAIKVNRSAYLSNNQEYNENSTSALNCQKLSADSDMMISLDKQRRSL